MYFVERNKIEHLLGYIDRLLVLFDKEQSFQSQTQQLALERMTHTLVESILDVGNMMIDGFIMRDPGGYHDIIHIMVDEGVVPEQEKNGYMAVVDLRQLVVRDYTNIDYEKVFTVLKENRALLGQFSSHIRTYLDTELGVANAFTNE